MAKRKYPQTTLYHVLAAYGDVLHRNAEHQRQDDLFPHKIPPQTIGGQHG